MRSTEHKNLSATSGLCRKAEEQSAVPAGESHLSLTRLEAQRLVHELEVHQIELELQNAELRRTREELETALEKYSSLYDFAPISLFTLTSEGEIREANLSGARLVGVDRARLPGRSFVLLVASKERALFSEFLGKVFAGQGKESCEIELLKEGSRPLFVQIEAVADTSLELCRVVAIDITMCKLQNEKLETLHTGLAARAADLAIANMDLEAFNYSVSHDLRNPLSIINSYCQVIREQYGNDIDSECLGFIQEIEEGSLRMSRLIDTLLCFSGVARGEMHTEKVDLSQLASKVAMELQQASLERQVIFRIAPEIITEGDAELWNIVLTNLIGNAWKHTVNREDTVIEFGLTEWSGDMVGFVRDNGPGFDMAFADKLFMRFQRLPGTSVAGSGIGLATVDRIVKRHGGRVWAESKPDVGATFLFTLKSCL